MERAKKSAVIQLLLTAVLLYAMAGALAGVYCLITVLGWWLVAVVMYIIGFVFLMKLFKRIRDKYQEGV